jgi:hypothetical protein
VSMTTTMALSIFTLPAANMATVQLVNESTVRSSSRDHYGGIRIHSPSVHAVFMGLRGAVGIDKEKPCCAKCRVSSTT